MATSFPQSYTEAEIGFPRLLREWRQKRRLSQLDLALTAGVSQRHLLLRSTGC